MQRTILKVTRKKITLHAADPNRIRYAKLEAVTQHKIESNKGSCFPIAAKSKERETFQKKPKNHTYSLIYIQSSM